MRGFVFGAVVGAIAMFLHLQGLGPLKGIVNGWWAQASAPRASALQH